MQDFPQTDSFNDLQKYLEVVLKKRGFYDEPLPIKLMILTEEVGELARGIRKHTGVLMSETTKRSEVADEVADVCMILFDICNKLDINLFEAIKHKEEINSNRTWK